MIEQGSEEWLALRVGKATASRIADIVRETRSGASATRQRYLGELVAERLTGQPTQSFKSPEMEWGTTTEAQARDAYSFYHNAEVSAVAFVDHPRIGMSGCSPDGLIGSDGLIEIKCPATHTHIATLMGAPVSADYITQMQWQMACTGRSWCDWASFDPRLPEEMRLFVRRIRRDDARIAELEAAVEKFLAEVSETVAQLQSKYMREALAS